MLKGASNTNNDCVATGDKDQKPLTIAVECIVVCTKNWANLCISQVFKRIYLFVKSCAHALGWPMPQNGRGDWRASL